MNAVFAAALEAAASRASQRANDVIMMARLATAVHMRQAAESALALPHSLIDSDESLACSASASPTGLDVLPQGGRR